ncbi:hypothetical protein PPERSA_07759 [Pseudocohnilembus persalinus]|uniref:diacylglycerol O-acyltransferase n=1 Tax=Pseudocohnilembus persalinus TaxID=266149 RepID=A0A0V0R9X3_PSEPJ|nr:hypothetical protein PPERSA_07759 [Pseudocohnilembus persalinus]|eukprot:KRX11234.1 hypothetical protein PPERSA_07759 [Pseudocohnilembus persalinus]
MESVSEYCTKTEFILKVIGAKHLYYYFRNWTCIKEEELQEKNCLLLGHPHGVFNLGFVMNNHEYYPSVKCCASRVLLSIPISGLIFKLLGAKDVSAKNIKNMCEKGENFGLIPGGFEEATLNTTKENRLYLKKRKGFMKYALKYGYKIYPSFVFGENQLYNCVEMSLNKYKLPGVIAYSRNLIFPDHTKELHTVIGKPFIVPKIENPTTEEVNKYHEQYIQFVVDLYDRHKEKYGEGKKELVIY